MVLLILKTPGAPPILVLFRMGGSLAVDVVRPGKS